jgi:hypothetical protein
MDDATPTNYSTRDGLLPYLLQWSGHGQQELTFHLPLTALEKWREDQQIMSNSWEEAAPDDQEPGVRREVASEETGNVLSVSTLVSCLH